jgi:hypothetical protein
MALNYAQTLYLANLGKATISTPNPNLGGSGSITTVITGASNGTLVKTLIIKAQTNTSQGMVRIFVKKSAGSNTLLTECYIPDVIKSSRDLSYYEVIPLNYILESGEDLKASTENGDTFNIIAEAFDISYNTNTAFLGSSLEYTANSGAGLINSANSNLNGSGSMTQILIAGTSASGFKGCAISSITIKAQVTTSPGMVRLFIQDAAATTPVLFCEVIIPAVVQSGTTQTFVYEVVGQGSLCIPPDYSIWASTEVGQDFSVVALGQDWKYV